MIAELAGQFRCIACDYPGFGLSAAAAGYRYQPAEHAAVVAAFIEQLDLRNVTLVAQDWGEPIGLHAALRDPGRLQALVMANTWAWPLNGDPHFEVFSRLMGGRLGRAAIRRFNLFVNLMIPAGHRRRKVSPAEMSHYRNALPSPGRRQATGALPHALTAGRDFLAKERARWERCLPDHATLILEGAGHYLQSDGPGDFAAAIRTWHQAGLQGSRAPRSDPGR